MAARQLARERADRGMGTAMRSPCVRCGMLLHTGEGKVIVSFTVEELTELACATNSTQIRERLACAIGLLDPEGERYLRTVLR